MDVEKLLEISAVTEKALACVTVTLLTFAAVLLWRHSRNASERPKPYLTDYLQDRISLRREVLLLTAILAFGVLLRVYRWDRLLTPPFYASEISVIHIDHISVRGEFWSTWQSLFQNYQPSLEHESALMFPIAALFQKIIGPHPHLPVLLGAFWAAISMLAAYAFGRELHSRLLGWLFAVILAISPLQLAWSRIGGIYVGAVPHILIGMWLGLLAGKKARIWLSMAAALCCWASLYHYMGARVAMPLTAAAMVYGLSVSPRSRKWKTHTVVFFVLSLVAVYFMFGSPPLRTTFWPQYTGYLGSHPEENVWDRLAENADQIRGHALSSLEKYFYRDRAVLFGTESGFRWGMDAGGFCYLPMSMLGLFGLLQALKKWRQSILLLLFMFFGFLLPVLSVPTARRFLVMDAGWCALAAVGCLSLLRYIPDTQPLRKWVPAILSILFFFGGLWALANLALLTARLPLSYAAPLPFGDSGFGDGLTCLRCFQAGLEWKSEMDQNSLVVLFDHDPYRENRTSPGGLQAYGKLAALSAGKRDFFFDYYSCLRNYDQEPPQVGYIYDPIDSSCSAHLLERIRHTNLSRILWHFESASPWEKWMARRLLSENGTVSHFRSPLGDGDGIRVRTPRSDFMQVLRRLVAFQEGEFFPSTGAVELIERNSLSVEGKPKIVACNPLSKENDGEENCAAADFFQFAWRGTVKKTVLEIVSMAIAPALSGSGQEWKILGRDGERVTVRGETLTAEGSLPTNVPLCLGCGIWLQGQWWTVDLKNSRVLADGHPVPWLERKPWLGIAADHSRELYLLSAEQEMVVYDVKTERLLRRFPAPAWPRIDETGSTCTPMIVGIEWLAVANPMLGQIFFFGHDGRLLDKVNFTRQMGMVPFQWNFLGGGGSLLAASWEDPHRIRFYSVAIRSHPKTDHPLEVITL